MQNPPRGIQEGAVDAGAYVWSGDVSCCKALQETGCVVAAERDEAASGERGACDVRGDGRVQRGDGGMAAG